MAERLKTFSHFTREVCTFTNIIIHVYDYIEVVSLSYDAFKSLV